MNVGNVDSYAYSTQSQKIKQMDRKFQKSTAESAEIGKTQEIIQEEEMAVFKKEFYAELERIPKNRTIINLAINILEA